MPESLSRAGKAWTFEHTFGRISGFDWLLPRNRSGMHGSPHQLIARVHELNRIVSAAQRELLPALAELDEREAWLDDGAHDMPHWVSMQLGVSRWKAERWVAAGHRCLSFPRSRTPSSAATWVSTRSSNSPGLRSRTMTSHSPNGPRTSRRERS